MRKDPANAALSDADLIEILDNQSESANNYQVNTFQVDGLDDFFDKQRDLAGAGWDEGAARKEFRDLIRNAPREIKQDAQRQWERLVDRSEKKSNGSINSSVMRSNIDLATKSILEKILPPKGLGMLSKAEALGVPLLDYIVQNDGASAEGAIRAQNYIRKTAEDAILAKEQDLGRPLTDGEQGVEIGKVIKETLADENLLNGFRPTIVPSTPQAAAPQAAAPQATAPTGATLPPSYYSAAQPIPETVVKSGVPIYSPQTTIDLLGTAAGGGPLPATVKRAARAANMTTGEFLLKQADQLGLGDQIPEEMRQSVRKVAVRERGTEETLISAAPRSSSPLSYASNAFLNIITGTRPAAAVAVARPRPEGAQRLQVTPSSQYIATTGFGKSADGMTQTLHGVQGRNGYDKNHSWGNDHVHHGAPDQQSALALANYLKSNGVPVTEFKPWGSVADVHRDPGHYNGMSMDIPVGVEEHDRILRLIDTFYRSR